jgi:hypothetical protein
LTNPFAGHAKDLADFFQVRVRPSSSPKRNRKTFSSRSVKVSSTRFQLFFQQFISSMVSWTGGVLVFDEVA